MAVNPRQDQLQELVEISGSPDDGPVVMLNLNRYREQAAYEADPPGGVSADVSGHEAYQRYSAVALQILEREHGRVVWHTTSPGTVIGGDSERYHEVIAVEYPSVQAFLALAMDPAILEAMAHRSAGLEQATIIRCAPGHGLV